MFVIRNRKDYRDYLMSQTKALESQKKIYINKRDLARVDAMISGIQIALGGLDDWDKQVGESEHVDQ